ncbi:MAG: protein kinase domain-containing protein, partial [Kofleriaceae bacterium]
HDLVKLLDFGISKHVDPDQQVAMTKLTTTGVVMGTPLYMAPEQAMGNPIERPADIYACGVILYEMLAGKPPFDGATYAVLVAKLLTTEPPRLDEVRPGLPPLLVRAVHRALEKDPAARFPTAELFAAALPSDKAAAQLGPIELDGTLGTSSVPAVAMPSASPGRLRGLAIAVSAFAVAAATTAAVLMMSKDDEPARPAAPAHSTDRDPPAPPVASTGTLEIKTVPLGAAVTVDDVPRGSTPIVVTLEPGRHRVHVELAGHASLDSEEDVRENQRTSVVLRMPPAEPGAVATGRKPESPTPRDQRKPGGASVRVPPGGGARPVDPYLGASPGANGGSGATVERVEQKAPPDDTKARPPGNDDSRKPQGGSTKPNPY